MHSITTNYNLIYNYRLSDNYQFTEELKCINIKRNTLVKRTLVGYTEGYCLNGKFKSIAAIKKDLVFIGKIIVPF